jgi:hypothetical protein
MQKLFHILSAMVLMVAVAGAWAQDVGGVQANTPTPDAQQQPQQQQPPQPAPAYGQENPPAPVTENPPISGLDVPGLEPHAAPLSYLQPRAHLMETVDTNVGNVLGGSAVNTVTTALGGLDLQRLWKNYKLALDYTGGVGYYSVSSLGFKQVQMMDLDQRINWKRGQLGIQDSFSYLPEGSFGEAYGSMNGLGQLLGSGAFGGENVLFGSNVFGSLSQVPRIMNIALVDAEQDLSPKSAITAVVSYGFVHYTEDISSTLVFGPGSTAAPISFIGNSQETGEVGYDRILGPHDQAAIVYAYQNFDFSVSGTAFHTQIAELMWGHRISGRMDLLVAAGPQLTNIHESLQECNILNVSVLKCGQDDGLVSTTILDTTRLTAAGRASLRYRLPKTSFELSYDHYTTSGSGFFAGAQSDIARLSATRPISRQWFATLDAGYAKNKRLDLPASGIPGSSFGYGFAGFAVHRMLGRYLHVFASYQFNELEFDSSFCQGGKNPGPCNRISQRQLGTIGLDWTPRPIRLD